MNSGVRRRPYVSQSAWILNCTFGTRGVSSFRKSTGGKSYRRNWDTEAPVRINKHVAGQEKNKRRGGRPALILIPNKRRTHECVLWICVLHNKELKAERVPTRYHRARRGRCINKSAAAAFVYTLFGLFLSKWEAADVFLRWLGNEAANQQHCQLIHPGRTPLLLGMQSMLCYIHGCRGRCKVERMLYMLAGKCGALIKMWPPRGRRPRLCIRIYGNWTSLRSTLRRGNFWLSPQRKK